MATAMHVERVHRGQHLWQAGEPAAAFYLVLEGTVQLLKPVRRPPCVTSLSPGVLQQSCRRRRCGRGSFTVLTRTGVLGEQGTGRGGDGVLTELELGQSLGEVTVLAAELHATSARASSRHVDLLKVRPLLF